MVCQNIPLATGCAHNFRFQIVARGTGGLDIGGGAGAGVGGGFSFGTGGGSSLGLGGAIGTGSLLGSSLGSGLKGKSSGTYSSGVKLASGGGSSKSY